MDSILAIDIGGTKVDVGLVSENGTMIIKSRLLTQEAKKKPLYERVLELAQKVLAEATSEPVAVGIGCGGPGQNAYELVSPLNIPEWREFPLRTYIEKDLAIQTYIDNDAKALALAEGWLGAAKDHTNFIAMVVSTGIGGGIVLNGELLEGTDGNAGHIGHVFVDPDTGLKLGSTEKTISKLQISEVLENFSKDELNFHPSNTCAVSYTHLRAHETKAKSV